MMNAHTIVILDLLKQVINQQCTILVDMLMKKKISENRQSPRVISQFLDKMCDNNINIIDKRIKKHAACNKVTKDREINTKILNMKGDLR